MGGIIISSAVTPKEVRERLLAMFEVCIETKPGVLKSIILDEKCPLEGEYAPILIGISVRGSPEREQNSLNKRLVTRIYEMRVLFHQLESASLEHQNVALDEALMRLDELPDWLAQFPRLELHRAPLHGVHSTGHLADIDGAQLHLWASKEWSGATYELPVTTLR